MKKQEIKKNNHTGYISNAQKFFDLFNSGKTFFFTIAVVVVAVLNLWLSIKLTPIVKDLDTITSQVNANTTSIGACYANFNTQELKIDEIKEDVSYIRGILESKK